MRVAHEKHLSGYWPAFFMGTAVEVACFLMLVPNMFTLVVGIKTVLCLAMWLSHQPNGRMVSHYFGHPMAPDDS
jgi:hypothetical protein